MDTSYGFFEFSPDNLSCYIAYQTNTYLSHIKRKPQLTYLANYLENFPKNRKKVYFLYENEYIDQHYIEDYSVYYSRCFNNYKKVCSRIHFFYSIDNYEDCRKQLSNALKGETNTLIADENYLGFIVIRPIPETFLAKMCLKPYYELNNKHDKFLINKNYKVSLFGIKLSVSTIACQEQDKVVSACATTAIWTFLNAHPKKDLNNLPSSSSITASAYSELSNYSRDFPNRGLSIEMMCNSLKRYELSPEYFQFINQDTDEVTNKRMSQRKMNLFKEYIYSYSSSNHPLILGVEIKDKETGKVKGLHAVTIVGYSLSKENTISEFISHKLEKIYVHDDRFGPFLKVIIENDNFEVKLDVNEEVTKNASLLDEVYNPDNLIIGVYHKIRIPYSHIKNTIIDFNTAMKKYIKEKNFLEIVELFDEFKWDIQIIENNELKEYIQKNTNIKDKEKYLIKSWPKYIWSVTAYLEKQELFKILFDATDIEQGDVFIDMMPLCNEGNTIIEKYIKDYCVEKLSYNPSEQYSDSSFSGIVKYFRKKETHEETLKKLFGYLKIPKYLHKIELQNDEIIDKCEARLNFENTYKLKTELEKGEQYIWVIDKDGFLCIGIESKKLLGGHPTLTNGMPARIGGELIHIKGNKWEVNSSSGRYSKEYETYEKDIYLKNAIKYKFNLLFPENEFILKDSK
ncbi:hypothetical protein [Aliarcobacter butzleri]|uniref:hypothetical protein n=1 Tax=Aliarcobacter butzleri TaxID=28197 RepID=UPI00263E99DB|nr:hypothetical protein [Aliarcobacter butzleri]MDN5049331.1 hypothetical protein [Aliarcobacter butzleri]MDN5056474.1 hypothetical protein [Aliarcobacter butzleri]